MNKKLAYFSTVLTLLFGVYSCSSTPLTENGLTPVSQSASGAAGEKTLLSIYMVGGNLEDDVKPRNNIADEKEKGSISTAGAGSNDLRELITGYENLSQAQKNNLDVVVAFGGARKEGWSGVKYADMPCLIKDSQDRYFGNDSCYMYKDSNANMAKQNSLESYLKFVKGKYGNNPRKVLDLWDHGFAYLGMGQDSLNGNDLINLKELKTSFQNTGLKFNLLSFDACLMGSIEVAKTVKDFTDYMVASEELEPVHGWNYTDFVNILVKNNLSVEEVGKKLVDSYIDSPEHNDEFSKYKTLSLINLNKLDSTIQSLDTFSSSLNMQNFSKLLSAVEESQKFGDSGKSDLSYTIDLVNWVTNIKNNYPEASASAQNVLNRLSELVVYSRHDASKPNSNGISIYSLSKNMENKYGTDQTFSKTWLDFSRSFVRFGTNDSLSPVVKEEMFSAKSDTNDCITDGKAGNCLDISDNLGLKSVEQVFALKTDNRYLFTIGSNQIESTMESSKYFSPVWDGEWFLLCNGDCKSGTSIFPPAYFNSSTENGSRIYSSDAVLNGEDVIFYIEVGKNNRVLSHWAVPYTTGDNGEILLNRNQLKVNIGDTIQFYYQVYDTLNKLIIWKKGEPITFSGIPQFDFAKIDSDRLYYVQAEDYKGNISTGNIHEVK